MDGETLHGSLSFMLDPAMSEANRIIEIQSWEVFQSWENRVRYVDQLCFTEAPWGHETWEGFFGGYQLSLLLALSPVGEPIGYVAFSRLGEESELMRIGVVSLRRRAGIGQRLVAAMIAQLQQFGIRTQFLEVREDNLVARSFYQRLGYREVGRRKDYYTNPKADALLLSINVPNGAVNLSISIEN